MQMGECMEINMQVEWVFNQEACRSPFDANESDVVLLMGHSDRTRYNLDFTCENMKLRG